MDVASLVALSRTCKAMRCNVMHWMERRVSDGNGCNGLDRYQLWFSRVDPPALRVLEQGEFAAFNPIACIHAVITGLRGFSYEPVSTDRPFTALDLLQLHAWAAAGHPLIAGASMLQISSSEMSRR